MRRARARPRYGHGLMWLVADVGGTSSRLALVRGGQVLTDSVAVRDNDRFAGIHDLLRNYLTGQGHPHVSTCCLAIAGPVTSDTARLTNRDWTLNRDEIAGILGGAPVLLINDLAALGHALPVLGAGGLVPIRAAGDGNRRRNGQAMVIGVGTGFNLCLTRTCGDGIVVIEAEAGHAALPISIAGPLAQAVGAGAAVGLRSHEDCFSGRGLGRLHRALSGQKRDARAIIAAATAGDTAARASVDLLAGLLGRCVAELIHFYLPFEGVHLAGGVARALFAAGGGARFLAELDRAGALTPEFRLIPVSVIDEDTAALLGCAAFLDAEFGHVASRQ